MLRFLADVLPKLLRGLSADGAQAENQVWRKQGFECTFRELTGSDQMFSSTYDLFRCLLCEEQAPLPPGLGSGTMHLGSPHAVRLVFK